MKFLGLLAVFTVFLAISFAGETDINFYFADMLAGAGSGASCGSSSDSSESSYNNDTDTYDISQTIYSFFAVNDAASNDVAVNVVYSNYAPLISPFVSSTVSLTTSSSIVNNGATTSYCGVAGLVDYLNAVSTSRNSSIQLLTNLIFDFDGDDSVTVNAVYTGIESLNSNFSFQTFYGRRTYQLARSDSNEYGWAINSVTIIRDVTRPSPEYTATFTFAVQAVVMALFDLNDIASNDNASDVTDANYDASVSPLVTSDFYVVSSQPSTGDTTYGTSSDSTPAGASAYVAYLHSLSAARAASQTDLSSFEYHFNYDQSMCTVNAKASGWESLAAGGADIFFGTRTYTVVRGDDGVWTVSSLTAVRSATFTQ